SSTPPLLGQSQLQLSVDGGQTFTSTSSATTPVDYVSSIAVTKTDGGVVTDGGSEDAGDTVTYSYKVTNTGTDTLTNVTATDDKLGAITLATTTLAPGQSTTGTATATLTQAQIDAGSVTNIVTADGKPPSGPDVTNTATDTVPLVQAPSIAVTKREAGRERVWVTEVAGDTVTYTYKVTNTSNDMLTNVTATDIKLGAITLATITLAPGQSTFGPATAKLMQ